MKAKPYKARSISGAQQYVRLLLKQRMNTEALLSKWSHERRMLAKLAASGPAFYNPLDVYAAQKIRDVILEKECRLNPDGTPLTRSPA